MRVIRKVLSSKDDDSERGEAEERTEAVGEARETPEIAGRQAEELPAAADEGWDEEKPVTERLLEDKPMVRFSDVEPREAESWAEEEVRAEAKPSPLVPLISGQELLLEPATAAYSRKPKTTQVAPWDG